MLILILLERMYQILSVTEIYNSSHFIATHILKKVDSVIAIKYLAGRTLLGSLCTLVTHESMATRFKFDINRCFT